MSCLVQNFTLAASNGLARAVIASERRPPPAKDWLEKEIGGKPFKLGKTLDDETWDQIAKVISRHLDAFAWSASDMPGIDPDLLSHCLAMDPKSSKSVKEGGSSMKKEGRRLGRKHRNSYPQATLRKYSIRNGLLLLCW